MRVRHRHRWKRAIAWGAIVVLSSLAGSLWFAYAYVTNRDTIVKLIRAEAPRYLPDAQIDLGTVGLGLFRGEVHATAVTVSQKIDGESVPTVKIPWLSIRYNPKALWEGRFEPSEVAIAHPILRLRRRKDGKWNLQGLLADPWPGPVMKTPPVQILNGTVELSDGPPGAQPTAILRDVMIRIDPNDHLDGRGHGKEMLTFEGSAKGDLFDRLSLKGAIDPATGQVEFSGDLARLAISDPLRSRLPPEWRTHVDQLGLTGGEVDLNFGKVSFDPLASPQFRYDVSGRLRAGAWSCPKLPFPLNDLTTSFAVRDSRIRFERAEAVYGETTVRLDHASFDLNEPKIAPMELALDIIDLKLDEKLHAKIGERAPPEFKKPWKDIWKGFKPTGRVTVSLRAKRDRPGGQVWHKTVVDCIDVAILYEHFKYPLDHISGRLVWEGERLNIERMHTIIGGRPLVAVGTVDHPGPNAVVALDFKGEALPIDNALFKAMPPEVREVVTQFNPTGTVGGTLKLGRWPPAKVGDDPRGIIKIDAYLDLSERCSIRWVGLPYPVNNLTGRLEIHPDLWVFKNMKGGNGQAEITGDGRVEKLGGTQKKPLLKVALELKAVRLPLDDQLRDALPPAWKKSWEVLEPTGSADVDAHIKVVPGAEDYHLEIRPRAATGVCLKYTRDPKPATGDRGGTFKLRMEDVTGLFVFKNGPVDMFDVKFRFHDAPVEFARGRVTVEDSGKFQLGVEDLYVKDIRLDQRLRSYMPPVMDQFSQRLDESRTFYLKGNLGLGWSGQPGAPAWCRWDNALVLFNENNVTIRPGLMLEHINGEFSKVRGFTDGETFDLHGTMKLASVILLGQQVTQLEAPVNVDHGVARLDEIRGTLLGGDVGGWMSVSLDSTPKYATFLSVRGADLQEYAKTLHGRQSFRGKVDGQLQLSGFGGDPRTLRGDGEARVVNGDLGELPWFVRLIKLVNMSPATKTAFDSADVVLSVRDGTTYLDPILFTGDAFSLHGRGTMGVQGELDLGLRVLLGRDRIHVRGFSDALREASGQFLVVRVQGTPSSPLPKLVPLPEAADFFRSLGRLGTTRTDEIRR